MSGTISFKTYNLHELSREKLRAEGIVSDYNRSEHYEILETQVKLNNSIKRGISGGLPFMTILDILSYIETIHGENITKDDVKEAWKDVTDDPIAKESLFNNLMSINSLLNDQLAHIRDSFYDEHNDKCKVWNIIGSYNGSPYGSINVFHNPDNSISYDRHEGVMIQNIVKFPLPFIVQTLFPRLGNMIPKLNTILELPITTIVRTLNLDMIFVRPVGNQGSILERHYGYYEIPGSVKLRYPCKMISVGFGPWYYKQLTDEDV